jgi:hypothetical protein
MSLICGLGVARHRGLAQQDLRGREPPLAKVPLVEERPSLLGEHARQALAVKVDPLRLTLHTAGHVRDARPVHDLYLGLDRAA